MPTKQSKQSKLDWKPHAYQKKAVKFMLQNSCAGLFLDPGLGKTSISLAALKILKKEGMFNKALIIAPLRVCYSVWPEELNKWNDFKDLTIQVLHGKDKERNLGKDADIYVINPEGLPWLFGHKKLGFDVLIVDESTKFKASNTQRFKILRQNLQKFRRRYILTGSPAPNGLLDLFGQIYILDRGAALGAYITHYRSNYFYPSGFNGYDWKPQSDAAKRIQEKLKPLTLRLAAEDYLDLPAKVVNQINVELPPEARRVYEEMEKELIASLAKGDIVAASAAVASGKCSQIANGGLYDEDHVAHFMHDEKAKAIVDLIEQLSGVPLLVAYEFQHDLQRLLKLLGKDFPWIGGGTSPKKAAMYIDAWNRGELPGLLGQPASMAHGVNMQGGAGNHVAWHSLTWNYEHYDQFNKRVLRQGSTHKRVFIHHVVARGTIDEVKLHSTAHKHLTQKELLDALNKFMANKKSAKK